MKAVLFPIAFLAAAVSAQQSSACAADYIVTACLGTSNGNLATCGENEYQCKCDAYKQSVQCFNNCPNDSRKNEYENSQTVWCGLASQYPSSTSTPVSKAVSTAAATTTADEAANTTPSGTESTAPSSTGSASGSATPTNAANSAADVFINAGGVLAAVAAVVAAVL
ncbi:hypothetical protein DL546_004933 [Coniochaeta pulveracea]|uniref:Extracellular membrane protein CFEM domain-containing protein n=1 Tax=Coniochaeta pulveracea TaxID=177199 RepID=A0A420YNH2_9PEZI|nr:hypothetical protein DL546_004933 [Coniochaeta pulveracea]